MWSSAVALVRTQLWLSRWIFTRTSITTLPMWTLAGIFIAMLYPRAFGYPISVTQTRLAAGHQARGSPYVPQRTSRWLHRTRLTSGGGYGENNHQKPREDGSIPPEESTTEEILYEECSRYADKTTVAQDVIFEITSLEHFQHVVSRALGADEAAPDGYQDAQGRWRHPHKLMIVEIYADWCRACKGLQPKLLKYIKKHPDVLCCKVNKAKNEELAAKLGVRGLPMIILYKRGKRIDHMTTANINTIAEAVSDSL